MGYQRLYRLRTVLLALILPALLLLFIMWLPVKADSGLQLVKVVDGLSQPVYVTHAGDGSGRLFVVEQDGVIRIIKDGQLLPDAFLDIRDRVKNQGEAGLLSVAFPANYAQNGYFFVYYNHDGELAPPEPSDNGNNGGFDSVVARFRVTADPDRADAASEERILVRSQPYTNHNGGLIAFGADGYLYIGLGDGGSGGDPQNQAQNTSSLLGKLLRVQVGASGTYTVPSDNPFAGAAPAKGEIWHYGLRNPWRWSFDRATGDLLIGDVGQNAFEEVDYAAAGQSGLNFGWRCKEGFADYNTKPACTGTLTDPITAYGRTLGQAVTGGYVYRGPAYPALNGVYFYADYSTGRIWSMVRQGGRWSAPSEELDTSYLISSFGEDEAGELYVVDLNGAVYRLTTVLTNLNERLYLPAVAANR